jgi:threonine dehydratase
MATMELTLRDVYRARANIRSFARRTPLAVSRGLGEREGGGVLLKLENLQETGSFKLRGATNKIVSLSTEEQRRGVITVSTGNHGRAVSYVAQKLGLRAVICLSHQVPPNKVRALRELGAELVIHGQSYDEAMVEAARLAQDQGLTWVDPFDDPFVIAGQGTIGLELIEDLPQIDTVIVPLSGGGLISGIGLTLKSVDPGIRVLGVSMERAPVMYHSLRAGKPIEMDEEPTLADALAGGIYLNNKHTFRMVRRYVDETYLVSEEEIASAIAFALEQHHLVVEGGGAVGIAALLHGRIKELGRNSVVVISGGNLGSALLAQIAQGAYRP